MIRKLDLQFGSVRVSAQRRRLQFLVAPCMALMDALMCALALGSVALVVNGQGNMIDALQHLQAPWFEASSIDLVIATLTLAKFWLSGHYTHRRPFWDDLRLIWRVLIFAAACNCAIYFLARLSPPRISTLSVWAVLLVLLPLGRVAVRLLLERVNLWRRPILIVGHGQNALDTYAALLREKHLGMEVIGFATLESDGPSFLHIGKTMVPVYRLGEKPEQVFAELGGDSAVIALDWLDPALVSPLIARLNGARLNVAVVPTTRDMPLYGLEVQHFRKQDMLFLHI